MDPVLELLIALESLDAQLDDFESEDYLKSIGLNKGESDDAVSKQVAKLKNLREEIVKNIPVPIYKRYEKLRSKYHRGVAPVINGICSNCFMEFPSALISRPVKNKSLETCPNCGIYVYWTK
jgi:predicted  nucleic acid-binding Zn-ribbon protein